MEAIESIQWAFGTWPRAAAIVAFIAGVIIQAVWRRFSVQALADWSKRHRLAERTVDEIVFPLILSMIVLFGGVAFNRAKAHFNAKGNEQQQANSKPTQDEPPGEGANSVVDKPKDGPVGGGAKASDAEPAEKSIVIRAQGDNGKSGGLLCTAIGHSRLPLNDFVNISGSFYRCEHCKGILKFVADADGVKAEWPEATELAPVPPAIKPQVTRQRNGNR